MGLSSGGFYEPGYREGGKLQLKMMCLGKNWDPERSEYGDQRPSDGAKPPLIPSEFCQLVKGAIQAWLLEFLWFIFNLRLANYCYHLSIKENECIVAVVSGSDGKY